MTQTQTIRVLIVDDQDMLRQGLTVFLRTHQDLMLVGEASSGEEAIEICDHLQPDVVLMDIIMPGGMDGLAAICAIRQKNPHIRFIALTGYDDEKLVYAAIQAGVMSYLLKNVTIHDLAEAIRATYAGKPILAHEASQALVRSVKRPANATYNLTSREHEVLSLMVEGATNGEIAKKLSISYSTTKKHVSNVLAKLKVTTRTEAVALALQNHIIVV
jgi:two-component system, NarL family, response regulator LiaR